MMHYTRACRRCRRSSHAKQRCGRPGSASTPAIATASSCLARCMAPWPWHTTTSCSNRSFFSRLACYGCSVRLPRQAIFFPHAAPGRPLGNVPLWPRAYRQMGLIKVVADHREVLFDFNARHLPANGPKSSSVVSVGCARFGCFCNRHVRQALPWFCWLKTTSGNLPFARHGRAWCWRSLLSRLPTRIASGISGLSETLRTREPYRLCPYTVACTRHIVRGMRIRGRDGHIHPTRGTLSPLAISRNIVSSTRSQQRVVRGLIVARVRG
jgi:hypothetical protein